MVQRRHFYCYIKVSRTRKIIWRCIQRFQKQNTINRQSGDQQLESKFVIKAEQREVYKKDARRKT